MNRIALAAAAAVLAAPAAFAQAPAATFVTGGPILYEGAATSKPIRGAVIAEAPVPGATVTAVTTQAPATNVLGGPAAVVAVTQTTTPAVRHYWNVPPDINSRMEFHRWRRLP